MPYLRVLRRKHDYKMCFDWYTALKSTDHWQYASTKANIICYAWRICIARLISLCICISLHMRVTEIGRDLRYTYFEPHKNATNLFRRMFLKIPLYRWLQT